LNNEKKFKIRIEDIANYSTVPFTIFDAKDKILCRKGDLLDSKLLSRLSMQDIFKIDTTSEPESGFGIVSKISKETTEYVISITQELLEKAEKGEAPSINACMDARDRIYNEVTANIELIQHIGELRIYYDDYNLSHGINVSTLSTAIGIKLGLEKDELKALAMGALLHDIGKTKIPKQLINKPGKLTAKEFEVVKLHAPLGYKIIRGEYSINGVVASVALDHHERYDGSGYTKSKEGEMINKFAQIVSIADVYDASSSNKVYAGANPPNQTIKEMLKSNKHFNPRVLYTLVHMVNYNTGSLKEKIAT
jgi:HD-GYP domain-containing protein (c-di-GMP phosphodiesterase class II)